MSDLITAAESIRRLAVQYQGMLQAADALESMGQIEQTTAEALKVQADAIAGRDAVLAEIADIKASANEGIRISTAQADSIIQDALSKASGIVESSTGTAKTMLDQARTQAEQIKADAQALADSNTATLQSQIANLIASRDSLTADVGALNVTLDASQTALAASESKLSAIKAAIAQATSL